MGFSGFNHFVRQYITSVEFKDMEQLWFPFESWWEVSKGDLVHNFPISQEVITNASPFFKALCMHRNNKTLITSKLKIPQMEGYFGVFSTTGKQSIS